MKKGSIYINKDGINKVIDPLDFPKWEALGWVKGNTNACTTKGKHPGYGYVTYNNGTKMIRIPKDEIPPEGFVLGGLPHSDEHNQKIGKSNSISLKGKQLSEERKRKISTSNIGRIVSEETRTKISIKNKGNHYHTAESIQKSLETRKLNGNWFHTEATRKKISESHKALHISEESKQKANQKRIDTCKEKYGIAFNCLLPQCKIKYQYSKPNKKFAELLTSNNIEFEQEIQVGKYRYDFKVGNILIEINPSATHNTLWNPWSEPKTEDYHKIKSQSANEYGYRCIHIFDWDDITKIIPLLSNYHKKLYARNLSLKEVSKEETKDFLIKYHLQNSCNGQIIRLGLYNNNELVQLMTFGKPRYNRNYEWELLRLCTNPSYIVIGGAEKLFKFFVNKYEPKSLISYCDKSKFLGTVYQSLSMTKIGDPSPSIHWVNLTTLNHITDNLLRQKGFDQLFGTNYGKGTSNIDLIIQAGYVSVADCGQQTYIKIFDT